MGRIGDKKRERGKRDGKRIRERLEDKNIKKVNHRKIVSDKGWEEEVEREWERKWKE